MPQKNKLTISFWIGLGLFVISITTLVFLFSLETKETEAADQTWIQDNWSGGGNQFWHEAKSNKYWSKTEKIDHSEGISLINNGEGISSGNTKQELGDKQENLTKQPISGSLVSSTLDAKENVLWEKGAMDVSVPESTSANFYLQIGNLSKSGIKKTGMGEENLDQRDITWEKWIKIDQLDKQGSHFSRFARYKVALQTSNSKNSPRVTRVSLTYQTATAEDQKIDSDQSWADAETPVIVGHPSTIRVQLLNEKQESLNIDPELIQVEVDGLENCKISKFELAKSENGVLADGPVYTATAISEKPGTAKLKIKIKNSEVDGNDGNDGINGESRQTKEVVLTDRPEIKFVDQEDASITYLDYGYLKSSKFDAGSRVTWGNISYQTVTPEGTKVEFAVRVSDTQDDLGDFQMVKSGSDLKLSGRYFQYRIGLATENSKVTPVFRDLKIEFNQAGDDKEIFTENGFQKIDYQRSSLTATTPVRAGISRSKILMRLNDIEGKPVANFPAERINLVTEPKLGTIFYQQMPKTDLEGRITFECVSTTVTRKILKAIIKNEQGEELFTLKNQPKIDFVSPDDKNVYLKGGELNSSIFDAKSIVGWDKISWKADVPSETSLRMMIVTGNNLKDINRRSGEIKFWREVQNGEELKILARYIKYKVLLNNDNPYKTPVLKEVKIGYRNFGS